jgi:hypothetical protein
MNEEITIKHSIFGNPRTNLLAEAGKLRVRKPQGKTAPQGRPWTAEDDKALREAIWRGDQAMAAPSAASRPHAPRNQRKSEGTQTSSDTNSAKQREAAAGEGKDPVTKKSYL